MVLEPCPLPPINLLLTNILGWFLSYLSLSLPITYFQGIVKINIFLFLFFIKFNSSKVLTESLAHGVIITFLLSR